MLVELGVMLQCDTKVFSRRGILQHMVMKTVFVLAGSQLVIYSQDTALVHHNCQLLVGDEAEHPQVKCVPADVVMELVKQGGMVHLAEVHHNNVRVLPHLHVGHQLIQAVGFCMKGSCESRVVDHSVCCSLLGAA